MVYFTALGTQEGLTLWLKDSKNMLNKIIVITLYAIPTIALLVACFFISKKK
jgi:hypothetical protein